MPKATAGENKKFSGDNMKKLISVFAALALVGAASAQAPAMAAKGMGLSFGVSAGYVTDMFKQGDNLKKLAGATGGGAAATAYSNAQSATSCNSVTGSAGSTACSASGEGSSVSLNGIDLGLKVQYDVNDWLFVRSGLNYVIGLKNTYALTTNYTTAGSVAISDTATVTANGSQLEIPMLVGFNLIKNEKSAMYFAAGLAYESGSYDFNIAVSRTQSAGTATVFTDVTNTTKQSGLGIMWLAGGKTRIANGISIFGEIKFLSAAAAKEGAVTGTTNVAGTAAYANSTTNNTSGAFLGGTTGAGATLPSVIQGTGANYGGAATGTGGLDLSYTRWQVGVQYEM
jgi:hypothetical protein